MNIYTALANPRELVPEGMLGDCIFSEHTGLWVFSWIGLVQPGVLVALHGSAGRYLLFMRPQVGDLRAWMLKLKRAD